MNKRKNDETQSGANPLLVLALVVLVIFFSGAVLDVLGTILGVSIGIVGGIVGVIVGIIATVASLGIGLIGATVGIVMGIGGAIFGLIVGGIGAAFGILVGTAIIWVPALIIYALVRGDNGDKPKRKRDAEYI